MDIEQQRAPWSEERIDQVLRDVAWLRDNHPLRSAIVRDGRFCRFAAGSVLIEQGTEDQDVFFLLRGEVNVLVHGYQVAVRSAGQHIGEMAAINPSVPRSATVIARDEVVAVRLGSAQVWAIANEHPDLWRGFAAELARRLEQRGKMVERLLEMQSSEARKTPRPSSDIAGNGSVEETGYVTVLVLTEIHNSAVMCGLATGEHRQLLLGGVARDHHARFPVFSSPSDQLLSDLNELNQRDGAEAGADLLRSWLRMALELRATHPQAELFQQVIETLDVAFPQRETPHPTAE